MIHNKRHMEERIVGKTKGFGGCLAVVRARFDGAPSTTGMWLSVRGSSGSPAVFMGDGHVLDSAGDLLLTVASESADAVENRLCLANGAGRGRAWRGAVCRGVRQWKRHRQQPGERGYRGGGRRCCVPNRRRPAEKSPVIQQYASKLRS